MISLKEHLRLSKGSVINNQCFSSCENNIEFNGKNLNFHKGPLIMGILNITPDSFYDGGKYNSIDKALSKVEELIVQGADIIDIGGESTRPGSKSILLEEEISRVIPVLEKITKEFDVIISIDSTKEKMVELALQSGVSIVNDISGLKFEPKIAEHVAKFNAGIVLMHSSSRPVDMQEKVQYSSLIDDIFDYLKSSINFAIGNSISAERIIVDPGIGFGKTVEHNIEILRRLNKFTELGYPVLIGTSRKSFIGKILDDLPIEKRLIGSVITAVVSVLNGASILRVHDVQETKQAFKIIDLIYNSNIRN